jgi:hypothetical protein
MTIFLKRREYDVPYGEALALSMFLILKNRHILALYNSNLAYCHSMTKANTQQVQQPPVFFREITVGKPPTVLIY